MEPLIRNVCSQLQYQFCGEKYLLARCLGISETMWMHICILSPGNTFFPDSRISNLTVLIFEVAPSYKSL